MTCNAAGLGCLTPALYQPYLCITPPVLIHSRPHRDPVEHTGHGHSEHPYPRRVESENDSSATQGQYPMGHDPDTLWRAAELEVGKDLGAGARQIQLVCGLRTPP